MYVYLIYHKQNLHNNDGFFLFFLCFFFFICIFYFVIFSAFWLSNFSLFQRRMPTKACITISLLKGEGEKLKDFICHFQVKDKETN